MKGAIESRVKLEHFKTLAAKEDVANLLSLLETHFAPDGELPEVIGSPPIPFPQLPVDGADLGTEYEAGMSYAQLCSSLGLDQCGRPFLFAKVRHVEGLTAWTKEGAALHARHAKGKTPAAMFKDIRMHWHQLSGAHAIIRKLFSAQKEPSNVPGMLIADEVGLGKSFLSILLIAFFVELGMRKATKVTLPPIIGVLPSICFFDLKLINLQYHARTCDPRGKSQTCLLSLWCLERCFGSGWANFRPRSPTWPSTSSSIPALAHIVPSSGTRSTRRARRIPGTGL